MNSAKKHVAVLMITLSSVLLLTLISQAQQGGSEGGRPSRRGGGRWQPGSRPQQVGGASQDKRSQVISMNFEKADIVAVLKLLGQAAGVTMAIAPQVQGTITIASTTDIPIAEAFDIVNTILHVRGYAMIGTPKDRVVQVVPLKDAVTSATSVGIGTDDTKLPEGDSLVTQIIPLKNVDAGKVKTDLAPLLSKENAAIMSNAESNTVVITDTRSNVKRILAVIRELDQDVSDVITLEVIYLQQANAASVAETLTNLFEDKTAGQKGRQPQPPPDGGQPKVATEKGFVEMRGQVKITADPRTNSLVVSASKERIELIRELVKKLDKDVSPDVKVKIFQLKNADATAVAEELNQIFEQPQGSPEISRQARMPWDWSYRQPKQPTGRAGLAGLKENNVVPDVRTNSLIVTAREENMAAFEQLITTIDRERSISEVTRVYRLVHAKASDLADTLTSLFQGGNVRGGFFTFLMRMQNNKEGPLSTLREVTVVAEPKSNSLIVTGPPQVFETVNKMIEALDQQQSQVFIEVLIVDVTLDDTTQLGVEWSLATGNDVGDTASTNFGLADRTTGFKYSIVNTDVTALLQALMEKKKVKVISTPHITTMDNVEASIEIGQKFPIVTGFTVPSTGSAIPQFELQPISLKLTVTPHITSGESITMDILQTINDLQGTVSQGDFELPIINLREAKTSVMVQDSQTIIIGGIMKDSKTKTTRKVPILGDIPLIGRLFRDDETLKTTNELMVFLTPHIVNTPEEANRITQEQKGKLKTGKRPESGLKTGSDQTAK